MLNCKPNRSEEGLGGLGIKIPAIKTREICPDTPKNATI